MSHRFSIRQVTTHSESFAKYEYEIFDESELIARYWHDHRGEEHGITFVDGRSENWPVGCTTDFLSGGGPNPIALSDAAVAWLHEKQSGSGCA